MAAETPEAKRSLFAKLSEVKDRAISAGEDGLMGQLPRVREFLATRLGPAATTIARDDAKLTVALGYAYAALPYPIRLAVTPGRFIAFCLKHRDQLLPVPEGEAAS